MSKIELPEIEYDKEILELRTESIPGYDNIITSAVWKAEGTYKDSTNTHFSTTTYINPDYENSSDFIKFEELTEEDVFNWIDKTVGGINILIEQAFKIQYITSISTQEVIDKSNLPWKVKE